MDSPQKEILGEEKKSLEAFWPQLKAEEPAIC